MSGRIGILGGSGLYELAAISKVREERPATPYGDSSDSFLVGEIGGRPVAFLARHGRGHRLSPSEINYRANIFGFKLLGCSAVLSMAAVGSLREDMPPSHVCIPSQFIDRTRSRKDTFFDRGVVAHVSLADPVCPALSGVLAASLRRAGAAVTEGGTYVCMEGPQFSTRAESDLYRSWGASVIGMTNLTEAKLAREAELCYATMAMVTDYDCWRRESEAVSVETILSVLRANARMAEVALIDAVGAVEETRSCSCREALRNSVLTPPDAIPAPRRAELGPILGRYLP
ncbi:MAG: S-methyl-5'-thioadenosine phosphorylase [Thermoanaerobaculia bacterium]